jgi:hypothetical protein
VVIETPVISVSRDTLWALAQAGTGEYSREAKGEPGLTPGLQAWIDRFDYSGPFEPLPSDWPTGRTDLDDRLARVVSVVNSLIAAFMRYAPTRAGLRGSSGDDVDQSGFTISELSLLESDSWTRSMAWWVANRRTDALTGRDDVVDRTVADVDRLLPPSDRVTRSTGLVRSLIDLLDLPVWRYRHEVYAVWIGSLIYQALAESGWEPRFHLIDGRLEFAFRGVHLATFTRDEDDEVLLWWTELETPLAAPPSGRRKRGVKPDYRLRRLPLSHPTTDIVVVEAKQHLRSSSSEFADALMDYAEACPGALVLLANYGPVAASVAGLVPERYRPRTRALPDINPGEPEAVRELCELIAGTADGGPPSDFNHPTAVIRLSWQRAENDLDLHIHRLSDGEHTYYSDSQNHSVRLLGDVRHGPGQETVEIADGDEFLIVVNNFGGPIGLREAGAKVEIDLGEGGSRSQVAYPAPAGPGRWWSVAKVNTSTFKIEIMNDLGDEVVGG